MISDKQDQRTISQDDLHELIIPDDYAGMRVDKVLAQLFPDYSRSWLQEQLRMGMVTLNDLSCLPKLKVDGGERLRATFSKPHKPSTDTACLAENIPLNVCYQDDDLLVINKPVGLVVHPGAGNPQGTLQNALLYHFPHLVDLPRFGIVHRLDKDTSGLMVVALSHKAHTHLTEQIQSRAVSREYFAIVQGTLVAGGTVDEPIGRSPNDRKKMLVREGGRDAVTHYRIDKRFRHHTSLNIKLETGRTHQIRVHMTHIKRPIVGDPVYGGRLRIPKGCSEELKECLQVLKRQALHAINLGLSHPSTGEVQSWHAPLPDDMNMLLQLLEHDLIEPGDSK